MDKILKCDHSDESCWGGLCDVNYAVQDSSNFESMDILRSSTFPRYLLITLYKVTLNFESLAVILKCNHSNEIYCGTPVVQFIMLYKVVLTFESVDEILKREHSNESY